MAKQTNHPLKTLFLLALLAGVGWGAYEFVYKRGVLRSESTQFDAEATRETVRAAIVAEFESDRCLKEVGEISYRANEDHFRVRITISDDCRDRARDICERIASLGSEITNHSFGVFAYDQGGSVMAKFVQ